MSRTLNDIMTGLPEERRQHIEARAATLFEQETYVSYARLWAFAEGFGRTHAYHATCCLQAGTSDGYADQHSC